MSDRFVKYGNALLSGYSFIHSTMWGKPLVGGMPLTVSAELTNFCNLSCPECVSGSGLMKRSRGYMDPGLFGKLIVELRPYLYNINLYFQGEPMLHPGFFSILEQARGLRTTVSTNGHFLTEENSERIIRSGLNELIISFDGVDQQAYSVYRRNGDFNRVVEGIHNVALAKRASRSKMRFEIQFLVNRYNEEQIGQVRKLAEKAGAKLKLKSMQVITGNDAGDWMPSERKYSRYMGEDGKYIIKSTLPNRCMRLWYNPVVTWDGKVIPCCFDKDASHIMGDLNRSTFREIWQGKEFAEFRKSVLTGRSGIAICRNCTSGLRGVII
jgi:radical SAM protein with 4Fe4S-binding SPASM domain